MQMPTLQQFQDALKQVPAAEQPAISQYGAPLLRAELSDLQAAVALAVAGDVGAARRLALSKMTPDELDADDANFTAEDQATADAAAARKAEETKGAEMAGNIALGIVLGIFGL